MEICRDAGQLVFDLCLARRQGFEDMVIGQNALLSDVACNPRHLLDARQRILVQALSAHLRQPDPRPDDRNLDDEEQADESETQQKFSSASSGPDIVTRGSDG